MRHRASRRGYKENGLDEMDRYLGCRRVPQACTSCVTIESRGAEPLVCCANERVPESQSSRKSRARTGAKVPSLIELACW